MLRDVVGVEFKVGHVVTYPGRYSSTLYVNTGIVTELLEDTIKVEMLEVALNYETLCYYIKSHKSTLQRPDRATVSMVTAFELRYLLDQEARRQQEALNKRLAARQ